MTKRELQGRTALVTGASSGLGVDLARELAARGADLVLVARREAKLEELARELQGSAGVRAEVVAADLADPEARQRVFDRTEGAGRAVDILVNNAGFGIHGPFLDTPWDRALRMLQVDVVALTHLTRLFLPKMVERHFGRLLQVASIGAFQPSPHYGAYSAAKSYVLSLGTALGVELEGTGVSVTCLCPGVTATEFLETAGQASVTGYQRRMMMKSADVARAGIRALLAGRAVVVPGALNFLGGVAMRLLPLRAQARIAGSMVKL